MQELAPPDLHDWPVGQGLEALHFCAQKYPAPIHRHDWPLGQVLDAASVVQEAREAELLELQEPSASSGKTTNVRAVRRMPARVGPMTLL